MVEQLSDRELLARLLVAEAGNQGPLGKLAVGAVIQNRAQQGGYGQGLRGVMMRPGQFSPLNSVTRYADGEQGQDFSSITPSEQDYLLADVIMSGDYQDPTGGATHFYNPDISNPAWGRDRSGGNWTPIGSHIFGRADAGSDNAAGAGEQLFNAQDAEADLIDRLFGEGSSASYRGRAPRGEAPSDEPTMFETLADAAAMLELSGGRRRMPALDPYVVRGRQNVGSNALSRMGIASLA